MGSREPSPETAHRFSPAAPEEAYVYGSCSPGWHSAADQDTCIEQWISFVESEGIERVCCLLAGRHLKEERANVGKYEAAFGPSRVLHAPVPERTLVDADRLRTEILPFIEEGVEAGEPVVVQCLTGMGRTGQVLAAWLIYGRGYGSVEAIDAVIESGRDPTAVVDHGDVTRADLLERLADIDSRGDE